MKITIVTASFNQGKFIDKCLKSVLEQKGDFSIEHIIFDNCSTDDTVEALKKYQDIETDVDIKVFIESDDGQTSAINKGFSLATGDIVCWLNTDEWYEEGALANVISFFNSNEEVDVVFGDCDFVDAKGKIVKHKKEYFFSESMLLFYGCYIPSCSTFLRRHILDNGIYLNPEFKVTMDFDWYVRIAKQGYHFLHITKVLASFTWHENNISSTFVERRKVERRLVQDRYGGVKGSVLMRTLIYEVMRYFWLAIRVTTGFVKQK
jgi:glycosyltransferase involved in cell wall biosynthesis